MFLYFKIYFNNIEVISYSNIGPISTRTEEVLKLKICVNNNVDIFFKSGVSLEEYCSVCRGDSELDFCCRKCTHPEEFVQGTILVADNASLHEDTSSHDEVIYDKINEENHII
jgi:hypothetical protein